MGKSLLSCWEKELKDVTNSIDFLLANGLVASLPPPSEIKADIRRHEKIRVDLKKYFRKHGFDPSKPNWDYFLNDGAHEYYESGDFNQDCAIALYSFFLTMDRAIREKKKELAQSLEMEKRRKRGPRRVIPENLAEVILLGIELFRNDEMGLEHVRDVLAKTCFPEVSSPYPNNRVPARPVLPKIGANDIRPWANQVRQEMLRNILSRKCGLTVKSFDGVDGELEALTTKISSRVDEMRSRSLLN